jgi:putative glycosyltransferase (TIGR04348 family)
MTSPTKRIQLLCPAPPGSRTGNRVTALRWAGHLRDLGHQVEIIHNLKDENVGRKACVLVAMHAAKCATAVRYYRKQHPKRPLIVALTGTDLYRDLRNQRGAQNSLEVADRILLLQSAGLDLLAPHLQRKCHVVHQSSVPVMTKKFDRRRGFRACVVGHLRAVKDPMRCAIAARSLPSDSRIQIDHLGGAMTAFYQKAALKEQRINPRYRWLGERTHSQTRRHIAQSHLLVLTSKMEGGANVVSEACVAGTPILTTRIDGSIGLLGADHPGMFGVGETRSLTQLLLRCENDPRFYERLRRISIRKSNLFIPRRERENLRKLLRGL